MSARVSTRTPPGRLLLTCPVAALLLLALTASPVKADCYAIEVRAWSPTGIAGCTVYGRGLASHWPGPGVARNDCIWPWTDCEPIRIFSHDTGRSIVVRPTMFCDCYTGVRESSQGLTERLVDLDPSALKALGLWEMRANGLFSVTVSPAAGSEGNRGSIPDTSMSHEGTGYR